MLAIYGTWSAHRCPTSLFHELPGSWDGGARSVRSRNAVALCIFAVGRGQAPVVSAHSVPGSGWEVPYGRA